MELQNEVDKYVQHKFDAARKNFGTVHDFNLRKWALEKSSEVLNET